MKATIAEIYICWMIKAVTIYFTIDPQNICCLFWVLIRGGLITWITCRTIWTKGAQWFSITHDFALYLLHERHLIDKYFSKGLCTDEIFLQSIAYSSPYKDSIVDNNMRLIDWHRGNPYTFTISDYEQLITSDCLFARKFDENIDMDIVVKLFDYIQNSWWYLDTWPIGFFRCSMK